MHVVVEGLADLMRVANELDTATQHTITGLREGYAGSDIPGSISRPDSAQPAKPPNSGGTMNPARRHNGEGSIYPYRNGFAAHVWITTPGGRRQRKVVYGKTREKVHEKWLALHELSRRGPVAPRWPSLAGFMERWLREVVVPNLAPTTSANYDLFTRLYVVPDLGLKRLEKLTVRDVQTWLPEICARALDLRKVTEARFRLAAGEAWMG